MYGERRLLECSVELTEGFFGDVWVVAIDMEQVAGSVAGLAPAVRTDIVAFAAQELEAKKAGAVTVWKFVFQFSRAEFLHDGGELTTITGWKFAYEEWCVGTDRSLGLACALLIMRRGKWGSWCRQCV